MRKGIIPVFKTDNTQQVVWRLETDPFGNEIGTSIKTVENNLRFPGQYYDAETGLHQNYFRTYDPPSGRYVEADPIGLYGGINPYTYVQGNPIYWIDPTGLARFSSAEELYKYGNRIISDPIYRKRNGRTFCNQATNAIEKAGGNDDYDDLRANEIVKKLKDPAYATQISAEKAIAYAKNGVTVIAGILEEGHGHVAIVSPHDASYNNGWGTIPYVFNVGNINNEIPVNEAFRRNNKPAYYIRNKDM